MNQSNPIPDRLDPTPAVAIAAVQLVAMLALDPVPQVAADCRAKLTDCGLDVPAIDRLIEQARAIIFAKKPAHD